MLYNAFGIDCPVNLVYGTRYKAAGFILHQDKKRERTLPLLVKLPRLDEFLNWLILQPEETHPSPLINRAIYGTVFKNNIAILKYDIPA